MNSLATKDAKDTKESKCKVRFTIELWELAQGRRII
jgi:hypothetical protein